MTAILSIVIPTRNRFSYAKSAIKSVLAIDSSDIELVIQDSSDSNELGLWIESRINDKRVIYNYSIPPFSMTDNFNRAVDLASGDYVCIIGDDDGVNPEIVAAAYWARDNSLDALSPSLTGANYYWPDFRSCDYGDSHAGKLFINKFTGKMVFPNIELEMQKCVESAGQKKFGLPKVYFGLVRRGCLLKVRKVVGKYFEGVSPDVFGALAIANNGGRVCVIDYPLVLPGSSGGSNSGRSALGKHKGNLKDDPHMVGYYISQWPEYVPKFFSVQTVWAEAAVEALSAVRRYDLMNNFNWNLLYALCIVYHPDYFSITIRSFMGFVRSRKESYVRAVACLLKFGVFVILRRLARFVYRTIFPDRGIRENKFEGVADIESAVRVLMEYLRKSGKSFECFVVRDSVGKILTKSEHF